MTWNLRDDVGPAERCYRGTDKDGQLFGYVQEFKDGSAAYWFQPQEQAKAAPSLDAAKRLAAERAYPLVVLAIEEDGETHLLDRAAQKDPEHDTLVDAKYLAATSLKNIRAQSGVGRYVVAGLNYNVKRKIVNVRIVANDGTVLVDHAV